MGQASSTDCFRALTPLFETDFGLLPVVIDLSGVAFCEPCGLTVLHSSIASAQSSGGLPTGSRVILPLDANVERYLRRMDVLTDLVAFGAPEDFDRHSEAGFAAVRGVGSLEEGTSASRSLMDTVQADRNAHSQLRIALEEMVDNISYHSGPRSFGSACAQTWKSRKVVQLAIADRGRGISAALRSHPAYANLTEAELFGRAIELGVTSNPVKCAGLGLFSVSEMIAGNGGTMTVQSGRHRMIQTGHHKKFVSTAETGRVRLSS